MKVIILAGGSGTRLWPLSRNEYPKQFVKFQEGKTSLFQDTFERSLLLTDPSSIFVVTNEFQKKLVAKDVEELGYLYPESNILVEPEAKNTLPAIYAGVHEILTTGNDSVVVFSSDHKIHKADFFTELIRESMDLSKSSLITFGIQPDGPNTGYGYISPGEMKLNGYCVETFKEKPTYEKAVEYIQKGYFWNAGIFMFDAQLFVDEVERLAPEIYSAFSTSSSISEAFSKIQTKISIDYGIMEKSDKVAVVPSDIGWDDLGSFDALYGISEKDQNNNVSGGSNILIDSTNNYIHAESGKLITAVGVSDLIIVDNRDAMLVCKKSDSQRVKEIVEVLKNQQDERVEKHLHSVESWGVNKALDKGEGFIIDRISLSPGKKLDYCCDSSLGEQWTVVAGTGVIELSDQRDDLRLGKSIRIFKEQNCSIHNTGSKSIEIIKISFCD